MRGLSIHHRLVLYVSLGLLVMSAIVGALTYRLTFEHEIAEAIALERQLVQTVQSQAEVAAYAANPKIADGVIEGLRANPQVRAVRITNEPGSGFVVGAGSSAGIPESAISRYPLYSPVDGKEQIGVLLVVRNESIIDAAATLVALRQTVVMLLQVLATAVLIVLFSRHLIGRPVAELAEQVAAVHPGNGRRIEVRPAHADDEIGSLARSVNELIAEAEGALAEVEALATTDVLTGLPNRRAFMTRIVEEFARLRRNPASVATLLMLDLDHFKEINDQYSHAMGDAVLRAFGHTLAAELRQGDAAGRLGGEEFAVLLPGTTAPAAATIAERLREKVAETVIDAERQNIRVTVSIGLAEISGRDERPEVALARADSALYQAKHGGRNQVVTVGADGLRKA